MVLPGLHVRRAQALDLLPLLQPERLRDGFFRYKERSSAERCSGVRRCRDEAAKCC